MSAEEKPDPLEERAKLLVSAASVVAVEALIPLSNEYSFLEAVDTDTWDKLGIIAGVSVGIGVLPEVCSMNRFERLFTIIVLELTKRYSDGHELLLECNRFRMEPFPAGIREKELRLMHYDRIGIWVLSNLVGMKKASAESQCARAIGVLIVESFLPWWQ